MIYCGELKQNTAKTVLLGQLFDFADSKKLLYDALGGNDNFDPADLICTLSKGTSQSVLTLTKTGGDNDCNLLSDGMTSLELTAANLDTVGDLTISFRNAVEGSEIIFPCSFKFKVVAENIHEWHVAKTGSDSNSGHSFEDAKLTLAGVKAVWNDGDTVILHNGEWNEALAVDKDNITFKCANRWGAIISQGVRQTKTLTLNDGTILDGIQVKHTGTPQQSGDCIAIYGNTLGGVSIENCYIVSSGAGINLSYYISSATIINNRIEAAEYGYNVGLLDATSKLVAHDNKINLTGWTFCMSIPISVAFGQAILRDEVASVYYAEATAEQTRYPVGLYAINAKVIADRINLKVSSGNNILERGLLVRSVGGSRCDVIIKNSELRTDNTSSCYDILVEDPSGEDFVGEVVVDNCQYDFAKVNGTITNLSKSINDKTINLPASPAVAGEAAAAAAAIQGEGGDTLESLSDKIDNTAQAEDSDRLETLVNDIASQITNQLVQPDYYYDKTKTPWQQVTHKKGDKATEYARKNAYDKDHKAVTSTEQVIVFLEEPE